MLPQIYSLPLILTNIGPTNNQRPLNSEHGHGLGQFIKLLKISPLEMFAPDIIPRQGAAWQLASRLVVEALSDVAEVYFAN